ncbi:MAG: hypothetical protein CTY38_07210 [Methylotenera sp.]|uniref:hypothetical protein n=1 Tax=Methylotenera sp. TaxID=2051956 RepID=UPI000D4C384B|nr:hypothetical protein [Methylotenera sp.]PPC82152.1 MAG: hypothetical protein CTY38_07210 [Methylotenera sp.]
MNILDANLLNSDWLIYMLKKSSNKPSARLLSLFDILEDWLDAPVIHEQLTQQSFGHAQVVNHKLQDFLTLEAAKAGAVMPEMLASQLYFMAIAASQEKLNINPESEDPFAHSTSLMHAKSAAKALIAAQTTPEYRISKTSAYAIAASCMGALVVACSLFIFNQASPNIAPQAAYVEPVSAESNVSLIASAEQTSALIAQINQMRKGNCQLIEALQLPDSYRKVYFDNIVSGQISTNIHDQKLVHEILQKVRCNYTPMLMANSVN